MAYVLGVSESQTQDDAGRKKQKLHDDRPQTGNIQLDSKPIPSLHESKKRGMQRARSHSSDSSVVRGQVLNTITCNRRRLRCCYASL